MKLCNTAKYFFTGWFLFFLATVLRNVSLNKLLFFNTKFLKVFFLARD